MLSTEIHLYPNTPYRLVLAGVIFLQVAVSCAIARFFVSVFVLLSLSMCSFTGANSSCVFEVEGHMFAVRNFSPGFEPAVLYLQ